MFFRQILVPKAFIYQGQIIVRGYVFGIEFQCSIEPRHGLLHPFASSSFVAPLQLRSFKQGLAQFVDDFVIETEIECTPLQLFGSIFKDASEFNDGPIEITVLFVHEAIEPRHGPARSRRVIRSRAL